MTKKKDNTQIIDWLEKEMNKNGLFFFKPIDENNIAACYKKTGKSFCVFYVDVIQCIIEEEEFRSEGG